MNRWTKRILAAGAACLSMSFVAPAPADAAGTGPAAGPRCYQQPRERVTLNEWRNGGYTTRDVFQVTIGSRCRDINLVDSRADGVRRCANYWIAFSGMDAFPSNRVTVCRNWRVVFPSAREGLVYRVYADQPGAVSVRS